MPPESHWERTRPTQRACTPPECLSAGAAESGGRAQGAPGGSRSAGSSTAKDWGTVCEGSRTACGGGVTPLYGGEGLRFAEHALAAHDSSTRHALSPWKGRTGENSGLQGVKAMMGAPRLVRRGLPDALLCRDARTTRCEAAAAAPPSDTGFVCPVPGDAAATAPATLPAAGPERARAAGSSVGRANGAPSDRPGHGCVGALGGTGGPVRAAKAPTGAGGAAERSSEAPVELECAGVRERAASDGLRGLSPRGSGASRSCRRTPRGLAALEALAKARMFLGAKGRGSDAGGGGGGSVCGAWLEGHGAGGPVGAGPDATHPPPSVKNSGGGGGGLWEIGGRAGGMQRTGPGCPLGSGVEGKRLARGGGGRSVEPVSQPPTPQGLDDGDGPDHPPGLPGGGGGLAQGLGIRLFAFGGAYRPLATAHSDPLWARTCFGCVNGAPG